MIGRELKRILVKPAAFVCIIVYVSIMMLGVESDLRAGYETGLLNLFWVTENFGVTVFIQTLLFPIAAAGNYFDERKGHYDWLMQMRSGRFRYCMVKIVSAVVGGVVLYLISVLLFFALCLILVPGVRNGSTVESITHLFASTECYWYRVASAIGYYPMMILFAFQYSLHIGIYVLIGLCISVFCTNHYVFYAMPFLLTRVGFYIGGIFALETYITYGRELSVDGGWIVCISRNLIAYAVLGFIYYREMKWRSLNG